VNDKRLFLQSLSDVQNETLLIEENFDLIRNRGRVSLLVRNDSPLNGYKKCCGRIYGESWCEGTKNQDQKKKPVPTVDRGDRPDNCGVKEGRRGIASLRSTIETSLIGTHITVQITRCIQNPHHPKAGISTPRDRKIFSPRSIKPQLQSTLPIYLSHRVQIHLFK